MPWMNAPRIRMVRQRQISLVLVVAALTACGGVATPTTSPGPGSDRKATLQLEVAGGPAAGSYVSDPAATLNLCSENAGGGWRALYAGGDPWMSVDLSVGSQVGEPGHASDAALEIETGAGYLWIDQAGFRGGDPKGRSDITVHVQPVEGAVALVVHAATPNRTPNGDGPRSDIDLTWTCPT